ncbi:UDP-N-acetylmuramoyl-tripeptide--D-alanyl-D-alanine ligase [Opitutia bacterium]|nr:UDP-N-acetylmuramoyl-tripeptide--D-alanyl-D-alanine ligase [Opitutae bacterium]
MPTFAAADLAAWTDGRWTTAPAAVTGFGTDTRALGAGDAFVALRTDRRDGHDFLPDARARGAACALVSRPVADPLPQLVVADAAAALRAAAGAWRRRFPGPVVGVTGSVGKTSTKDLLGALLGPAAFVTEANLNNLLGVPLMLLRLEPTRHRYAVIEAGMSVPGELGVSAAILRPDVAIVTAVAAVHLEGVGSLAGVAREKATLVGALAEGGRAILPAALLAWPDFAAHADRCVAVRFVGEPAPVVRPARLVEASLGEEAGRRVLRLDGESFPLGPVSDGLARNAALAILAARAVGADLAALRAALVAWSPPVGRGSVHADGARTFYVDCYNSSPAALLDAARCFDRLSAAARPRLWVLGGMAELGADSAALHRGCGAELPVRADDAVVAFGGDAAQLLAGLPVGPGPRVAAGTLDDVRAAIAAHAGFVFVKGSRSFALERALPTTLAAQLTFH